MILNRFFERNFPEIKEKILVFSKKVKKFFKKVIKISKYYFKKYWKKLNKEITRINKDYPELIETFQLITIYILAFITFSKYIKSMLRYYPRLLKILVPFCEITGESSLFFYLGHQNYSYIFYTVLTQLLYRRKYIQFSPKIRFHIVYIMLLEILQSVIIQWLFFFFSTDKALGQQMKPMIATILGTNFFFFYCIYVYSLIMGLKNVLPYFPPVLNFFNLFVDSALFWVGLVNINKKKKK